MVALVREASCFLPLPLVLGGTAAWLLASRKTRLSGSSLGMTTLQPAVLDTPLSGSV